MVGLQRYGDDVERNVFISQILSREVFCEQNSVFSSAEFLRNQFFLLMYRVAKKIGMNQAQKTRKD